MVRRIGILPASGSASRLNGIPKFALPFDDEKSLIEYHIGLMAEAVEEIVVCTRKSWIPILEELGIPRAASVIELEPSTMNDAVTRMAATFSKQENSQFIVGMPDTCFTGTVENHYLKLAQAPVDNPITLLISPFREQLRGKVGQVSVTADHLVEDIIDKDASCNLEFIWSAFAMTGTKLNPRETSPSHSFRELIKHEQKLSTTLFNGKYHDLGTIQGISEFYTEHHTGLVHNQ